MTTTAARNASAANRIVKLGPEPRTLEEALASSEARHWQRAIDAEVAQLEAKGVWTPTTIPPGMKPVGSRWIFQRSPTPQGIKYRARVVAKGSDLWGDKSESDTGTTVPAFRFLLAYASHHDLELTHILVNDPCLTVNTETIVMAVPGGLKVKGNALILRKTLYGLKTAYAAGLGAVREALALAGLHPIEAEPCLLVAHDVDLYLEEPSTALAMTYSGGVVVAASSDFGDEVLEGLGRAGLDASLGPQDLMLGLTVRRTERGITLSQPQYIDRLVKRFDKYFGNPVPSSPVPTPELQTRLQQLAGCLLWLGRTTHHKIGDSYHNLASDARRQLSPEEWVATWATASQALERTQKVRNDALNLGPTSLSSTPDAPQLVACDHFIDSGNGFAFNTMIAYESMLFDYFWRWGGKARNEQEKEAKVARAAVERLIHWRAVLHEIGQVRNAHYHVDTWADDRRLKLQHFIERKRLPLSLDGIEFLDAPGEDEEGHKWCPSCCCTTTVEE